MIFFDKTRGWATTLSWNKLNTTVIGRVILNTDRCTLDQHLYFSIGQTILQVQVFFSPQVNDLNELKDKAQKGNPLTNG